MLLCASLFFSVSVSPSARLFVSTPCLKKTVQNFFCHKFVKCLPNLIVFGTQIAQRIGLCELHSFSVLCTVDSDDVSVLIGTCSGSDRTLCSK